METSAAQPASSLSPADGSSGVPDVSATIVRATQYGDFELFRSLIELGQYDINRPDAENVTLLHWAAINNRANFVTYLLSKGAQVDRIGGELQSTPLQWAIRQGHLSMCVLLIRNGADPAITDGEGYNALHLAAMNSRSAIVAYLLACGVDVDATDRNGMTALMWAAYKVPAPDPARLLIHFQANVNAKDRNFGNTPFCWAAMSGNAPVIRVLFDSGADASLANSKHLEPADVALQFQQYSVYGDLVTKSRECALRKRGFPFSTLFSQKSRTKSAFLIPLIVFLSVCGLFDFRFAWWIRTLGLLGTMTLIGFLMTLFDSTYVHKLPFGVMVTTKLLLLGTFCATIYPHTTMLTYSGFFLSFILAAVFAVLVNSKGALIPPPNMQEKIELLKMMAERPQEIPLEQFCSTCLIRRPLRSKHCAICNRCVLLFDHHSSWLYTCTGWKNQKYYLAYLVAFASTLIFYLLAAAQLWSGEYAIEYEYFDTYGEVLIKIATTSTFWVTWAAFNCCLHLTWSVAYLVFMIYQITFVGMTTNERLNAFRNRIFQTERIGIFRSPFKRGPIENWSDFTDCKLFGRERSMIDWRRVFTLEDYYREARLGARRTSGGNGRLLPV